MQVMATDADSHANSIITYSIIDGNPTGNFVIGPKDGIIQISLPLDREKVYDGSLLIPNIFNVLFSMAISK